MRPLKEIRVVANSSAHEHTDWWRHKRRVKSLGKTASCNHPNNGPKAMWKDTLTAPSCSATLRLSVKIHAENSKRNAGIAALCNTLKLHLWSMRRTLFLPDAHLTH